MPDTDGSEPVTSQSRFVQEESCAVAPGPRGAGSASALALARVLSMKVRRAWGSGTVSLSYLLAGLSCPHLWQSSFSLCVLLIFPHELPWLLQRTALHLGELKAWCAEDTRRVPESCARALESRRRSPTLSAPAAHPTVPRLSTQTQHAAAEGTLEVGGRSRVPAPRAPPRPL